MNKCNCHSSCLCGIDKIDCMHKLSFSLSLCKSHAKCQTFEPKRNIHITTNGDYWRCSFDISTRIIRIKNQIDSQLKKNSMSHIKSFSRLIYTWYIDERKKNGKSNLKSVNNTDFVHEYRVHRNGRKELFFFTRLARFRNSPQHAIAFLLWGFKLFSCFYFSILFLCCDYYVWISFLVLLFKKIARVLAWNTPNWPNTMRGRRWCLCRSFFSFFISYFVFLILIS